MITQPSVNTSHLEAIHFRDIRHLDQQPGCMLVVEDQDDAWQLTKKILSQELPQVELYRADSRRQTITFINERKREQLPLPRLILQDLYLPQREGGLSLLRDLRMLFTEQQHIPIIVVSSSTDKVDVQQAYRAGASFYVVKPTTVLDWTELFRSIRTFWWEQGILPIY